MAESNPNSRLEAFCDGVFAIALTLLIIDLKVPASENIQTTAQLWQALQHLAPSVFAFLLSFAIILITWSNHHNALKLAYRSSPPYIFANGFLLLTVVFIPFPTALLGEYILTDHAAPAVVLYSAVDALQAIGWILICTAALKPGNVLIKTEKGIKATREARRFGYYALVLYTACAIVAFWFPRSIAVAITIIWIFWLFYGINLKEE